MMSSAMSPILGYRLVLEFDFNCSSLTIGLTAGSFSLEHAKSNVKLTSRTCKFANFASSSETFLGIF